MANSNKTSLLPLTENGARALHDLQIQDGRYDFYYSVLNRVRRAVLANYDLLGMSNSEALDTIQALEMLQDDLGYIAGPAVVVAAHANRLGIDPADLDDVPYSLDVLEDLDEGIAEQTKANSTSPDSDSVTDQ